MKNKNILKYLINKLSELDYFTIQELENSITSLESDYYSLIKDKYEELDGIKFYKFIGDVTEKLFRAIKLIENEDAEKNNKKHDILIESYRKKYKILELEYKAYYPEAFKKHYQWWSLKDHKPLLINNPQLINKLFHDISSNSIANNSSGSQKMESDRNDILNTLINVESKIKRGENCKTQFFQFEKGLEKAGYLDGTWTNWLSDASSLIRFYFFCMDENHRVFRDNYSFDENRVKALKLLRKLYNFNEGPSVDRPTKMMIAKKSKKHNSQFAFLLEY